MEWNDYGTFLELDLAFADFAESVNSYKAETPDFVENYFANYFNRSIYEEVLQYEAPNAFLETTYKIHPEWRFGLWQCHKQGISDGEVLYSQFCWIRRRICSRQFMVTNQRLKSALRRMTYSSHKGLHANFLLLRI